MHDLAKTDSQSSLSTEQATLNDIRLKLRDIVGENFTLHTLALLPGLSKSVDDQARFEADTLQKRLDEAVELMHLGKLLESHLDKLPSGSYDAISSVALRLQSISLSTLESARNNTTRLAPTSDKNHSYHLRLWMMCQEFQEGLANVLALSIRHRILGPLCECSDWLAQFEELLCVDYVKRCVFVSETLKSLPGLEEMVILCIKSYSDRVTEGVKLLQKLERSSLPQMLKAKEYFSPLLKDIATTIALALGPAASMAWSADIAEEFVGRVAHTLEPSTRPERLANSWIRAATGVDYFADGPYSFDTNEFVTVTPVIRPVVAPVANPVQPSWLRLAWWALSPSEPPTIYILSSVETAARTLVKELRASLECKARLLESHNAPSSSDRDPRPPMVGQLIRRPLLSCACLCYEVNPPPSRKGAWPK